MELDIEFLRKLCKERQIVFSLHGLKRIHERGIMREDVISAILNGEIIEQYPADYPYPSCLILGSSDKNEKLHIVCGCNGETVKIITAYYPSSDHFEDDARTRRR